MEAIKRLCPVCGDRLKIETDQAKGAYIICSGCLMEYGAGNGMTEREVVRSFEKSISIRKNAGRTKPKPVCKIDRRGNVLATYRSLSQAAKLNPMSKTAIENRVRGRIKNEFEYCDFSFRLAAEIKGGKV